MTYNGLTEAKDADRPHLGGNIREGDPFTHTPTVWDYLIKRFAIASMLDLGSGMGYAADYFHRAGVKVLAAEGMPENVEKAVFPTFQIDLSKAAVSCRVDLVHCHEVVEHIDEAHIENLLASLACGRFILMTHALPGQGGHHHVNEKPPEYWISHLARYDCEVLVEDTQRIRTLASADRAHYMARTGLVLANRSRL